MMKMVHVLKMYKNTMERVMRRINREKRAKQAIGHD